MRQPGEVIAGFRIERLLGQGGMGEVYLVRHPRLRRSDALKLLPAAASADPSYRERFQREAELAALLDHDNVVTVYDTGETDGQLWIHMKYVAGEDAAAALRRGGPFSTRRALHTVTRVASALDDAHRHGLLHRDVKPANILLGSPAAPGDPERVFLTDFGIAKGTGESAGLTPSGHFAASLDYAAPEQILVKPLDGRADQYALGCVLFQLLTGSVPFPGEGAYARMNAHLTAPVPPVGQLRPGLPLGVQSVLDRAMAKAPEDRYETCSAMAAAFGQALGASFEAPAPATVPAPAPAPAPATAPLPGPRPPDLSETPPPQPAVVAAPNGSPTATPGPTSVAAPLGGSIPNEMSSPTGISVPARLPVDWWKQIDPGAAACLAAAFLLGLVSAFPPSTPLSTTPYPGEYSTGRFAAGELPALLLLVVAVGLQLTRFGHRRRPLLCGIAAGAGLVAAVDSLRVYAFARANPSGIYGHGFANTDGAIPRAVLGILVVLFALNGVRKPPPRPRPRPSPYVLMALLLGGCAVVITAVAVAIGPAIQSARLLQLPYAIPFALTFVSALVLGAAALTRRPPVLVMGVTLIGCGLIAELGAPASLHYPLAIFGSLQLLAAAGLLALTYRQPVDGGTGPPGTAPPGPPLAWPAPLASALRPPVPRPLARFRR